MFIPIIGGLGRIIISIDNANISDIRSGVTASAAYSLTSAGVINSITSAGGTVSLGNWITPTSAAGAAYEVYVTNSGDALTSGTVGSWLPLSSTQTWTMTKPVGTGFNQADLTVQIRNAATLVVLDTATITLYAEKI